ncbi:MAG: bifunctional metallophosphatase/5'-nucleotidase, partial [Candidatus Muiribacteriota bacterium]
MKKTLIILVLFVSFSSFAGEFSIFFTNDTHGRILPYEYTDDEGRTYNIGGAATMSDLLRLMRNEYSSSMLVDAGDIFHGDFVTDFFEGRPQIEIMNYLEYDLFTPGNHDLAFGIDKLIGYHRKSSFNYISSNMVYENSKELFFIPYIIKDLKGVKTAFVGFNTPTTMLSATKDEIEGVDIIEPAEYIEEVTDFLRNQKECELLIFITHLGLEHDIKIAELAQPDFIIGAHSHHRLYIEEKVGNTVILQAGAYYNLLGHLRLFIENGVYTGYRSHLYKNNSIYLNEDPEVNSIIEPYEKEV